MIIRTEQSINMNFLIDDQYSDQMQFVLVESSSGYRMRIILTALKTTMLIH